MATAVLSSPSGRGAGVSASLHAEAAEWIALVADVVEEWVIEELWFSVSH